MKVGVNLASHALNFGGGFKAAYWQIKAISELGHDVTIFSTSGIHPRLIPKLHGLPIRMYNPKIESQFDGFLTLNHFGMAYPLASKFNIQHIMFPTNPDIVVPDGLTLVANSKYTSTHIKDRWNCDSQVLYIPIENYYRVGDKEQAILHISRFAEANDWADKAHPQMIEAIRKSQYNLPGWRLILAGAVERGQDGYVSGLLELSKGLPVEFMFDPSDEEVVGMYAKAAIYWHATGISLPMVPSAQEHFGITPLEAAASGCVPIVFRSGGMPEVVKDRQTGLLFDDIREMRQMTVELANKLSIWAGYQQYGLIWARNWQDWESFKQRVALMLEGKPIEPALPGYQPELAFRQEDVTCIIPTMGNYEMLMKCLTSIHETVPRMPIWVINNGAENIDVPIENVQVFNFNRNLGFAGAYKWTEDKVTTPLVLMMNDDVMATNKAWLSMMVLPLSDPTVGIVGAKLVFPDGRLQHAGGDVNWGRNDIGFHRWYQEQDALYSNITTEVPFVTGACMLMRRELFTVPEELVGGLCYEELWMSNLAKEKGYSTIYQPSACLTHFEGITRKRTPEQEALVERNKQAFKARWMK